MKVVITPDSYKESLSVDEIVQAIEKEFREIFSDTQYAPVPVADGGEGTMEAMIATTQGVERHVWIAGPLGEKVNASRGISGDGKTTFIEMAAASGPELVSAEERDPLMTTSRGTGELILQALKSGVASIIIGIGGSTTNDSGAGMVQALGAKLCDVNGDKIGFGSGSLNTLDDIGIFGLNPRSEDYITRVAYDVTNPLVDDSDASRTFGPRKGANEAMIVKPDNDLSHYADVIKKALHAGVKDVPGTGAAGGMGAALMTFLGTELGGGTEVATTTLNPGEHIHNCTLVITGEERIDSQSIHGKIPIDVANAAKKYRKPVIGIAGSLTNDVGVVYQHGIDVVFSVPTSIGTLGEALRGAYGNICRASRNIAATLAIGMCNTG